jgi:ABC-type transport system involved in multi-copper enzyme maturation permease subunit
VVLTRRELSGYFYSPIAYVVMLAMALLGGLAYWYFLQGIVSGAVLYEPIVANYYRAFPPIVVLFLVPAITMRLVAEEKRTGTYEVMMCAPVKETTVVLSKFVGCLAFFVMLWGIWALYLIALRVEGGKEFDYRPLLGFYFVLTITGTAFVSMGLFFSSLSRNQVIGAVLTFMGMLVIFFLGILSSLEAVAPLWRGVFRHLSYADLWEAALLGQVHVREIVLQGTFAFFWLFMATKVLEARRWS